MSTFTISTVITTGQSLVDGESGYIGVNGAVAPTTSGSAIVLSGSTTLDIDGVVRALGTSNYGVIGLFTTTSVVNVGETGRVSGQSAGMYFGMSGSTTINNAGTISGYLNGMAIISFDSASEAYVTNTGLISAVDESAVLGVIGNGLFVLNNSGTISTLGTTYNRAVDITGTSTGARAEIMNTGTIMPSAMGIAILVTDATALVTNTGTIAGNISTTIGNDLIENSGTITGSIYTGDGFDIIRLLGGTVTGLVIGGPNNDRYEINTSDVQLVEYAGEGYDTVSSFVSFILPDEFEELELAGTAAISGGGNDADNVITGNTAANTLRGEGGNDTLDGNSGTDTLFGGTGNDRFIFRTNDTYVENASEGTDTLVVTTASNPSALTLSANIENFFSPATNGISVTGNASANRIETGAGNDVLNGTTGTDTLIGGAGNDTYGTDGGDTITDTSGIDTVFSSVSFGLASSLENLTLSGTANINATGNSGANTLVGNSGANILNGNGGTDRLDGAAGNDTYITDGGDTITDSAGTDTVQSSVTFTLGSTLENLVLTGSAKIHGTGNTLANSLTGNAEANSLNGLLGNDTLTGGNGADDFIFSTTLGSTNIDRITDFNAAADTIRLENAVFTGLAAGTLSGAAFVRNTSGTAADASDRIIYETDTGKLYFDRDGTGATAKVHFATVGTNLTMTSADFVVF